MTRPSLRSPRDQRGVSLLVALLLLLVMTIIGLAVLRGTTLQERMSGNLLDRTYQFQAAESALREAEALVKAGVTVPTSGCSAGVRPPVAGATDRWLDSSFSGWVTSTKVVNADSAITTKYFIEYMSAGVYGPNCTTAQSTSSSDVNCDMRRYRVTALSEGTARASVLLQTNYLAPP